MKIGINGLGRIGRLLLRKSLESDNPLEVVAINTSATPEAVAHLIKYDSNHGQAPFEIFVQKDWLRINNCNIQVLNYANVDKIPWVNYGIELVFECSGKCKNKEMAIKHLAKQVIVSGPCQEADATVVFGVNHQMLNKAHKVISIGSCTTNALALMLNILDKNLGLVSGYATTVHSYTFDQNLLDNFHDDLRRSRSATNSIIPTRSGVSESLKIVLPNLANKISGSAIRVPVPNVSLIDFSCVTTHATSVDKINSIMQEATLNLEVPNVLAVAKEQLVSVDFNHSPFSCIFDPFETHVINDKFVRVVCWYDNEWGFVNRLVDVGVMLQNMDK